MKKFNEFLAERAGKGLTIFDIDDTLFVSKARVIVKNTNTGQTKALTPMEFNSYKLRKNEEFDFGEFRSAKIFYQTATPIARMVAKAKAHPGVSALVASFADIAGDKIYDGIWANFSLLHADRSDMPRHLTALHTALKPGGIFHIALKTGTGEKRDRIGRLYTYYTQAELTDLVTQAGFTVTDHATGCDKGMDGALADWVALRAYG